MSQADADRALFNRISESYSAKDLSPTARPARRERLIRTLAATRLQLDGGDLLEIGCGAGFSVDYLDSDWSRFVGIDYSERLIGIARQRHPGDAVEFHATSLEAFETGDRFDLIFLIGVLHHMDDPAGNLDRMFNRLKPGGWLAMNEPQNGNPLIGGLRRLRKSLDASYSEDQATLGYVEMKTLLAAAGFTDIQLQPQGYFSTPFAEVPLKPAFLFTPLSHLAISLDRLLDKAPAAGLRRLSWNLIAAARKPE